MSAQERWERADSITPLSKLTRAQIAARVETLRRALALVAAQADLDGGPVYPCTGAMKKELIRLENDLRARDRQAEAGEPMPTAVALAAVSATVARLERGDK